MIKTFNEINKNDAATAGGKGASLGEMTRLFARPPARRGGQAQANPIPPGFVVLAETFERFIQETDIDIKKSIIFFTRLTPG